MKFALAIFTYLLIAGILSAGILLMIQGKPWLFIGGLIAYIVTFAQTGCKTH